MSDNDELVTILGDLRQRMFGKVSTLREMSDAAKDYHEAWRLLGKAQGVILAASFVDEAWRDVLNRSSGK